MTTRLRELVELIRGHRVFIQTHNFPDPDAIASAFGLQVLLEEFGITTLLCYHGNIDRTATANMVKAFGIEIVADDKYLNMRESDYIITVDAQKGNENILDLIGDEVACIDHHPVFFECEDYKFKDIRIVGSCATIIADYYRENGIEMPGNVATALLYGLKCDTRDFTRGVTQLDVDIYSYLFPKSNNRLIRHFQSGEIQYEELNAFNDSMRNIDIYNGIAFAFLDFSCTDSFIATISDFVLNIDVVDFAVVYAQREGGFKFSVRCKPEEFDAGQIIFAALKDVGSGGGHKSMAGGYADESKVLKIGSDHKQVIRNLFFDVIGKLHRKYFDVYTLSDEEIELNGESDDE